MKFGKEFRIHLEETLPEWRDKFLCYKPLKKLLKHFPNNPTISNYSNSNNNNANVNNTAQNSDVSLRNSDVIGVESGESGPSDLESGPGERNLSLEEFQDWFVRLLNEELDKFNDFYVEKEEDFVIRFQELKERIARVRENRVRDGVPASENEFSDEMMDIRKEFVTIHGEMVLLKNYSSLNFAGLVKILKKYDKRTGGLLRLPFTELAAHQPFFTTDPLTRLVRECEANLELLFPLEAEVTELTSAPRDQNRVDLPLADITNISGERAGNVRDQDDEGSGAVTAENSPSNPEQPSENEDNVDRGGEDSAP